MAHMRDIPENAIQELPGEWLYPDKPLTYHTDVFPQDCTGGSNMFHGHRMGSDWTDDQIRSDAQMTSAQFEEMRTDIQHVFKQEIQATVDSGEWQKLHKGEKGSRRWDAVAPVAIKWGERIMKIPRASDFQRNESWWYRVNDMLKRAINAYAKSSRATRGVSVKPRKREAEDSDEPSTGFNSQISPKKRKFSPPQGDVGAHRGSKEGDLLIQVERNDQVIGIWSVDEIQTVSKTTATINNFSPDTFKTTLVDQCHFQLDSECLRLQVHGMKEMCIEPQPHHQQAAIPWSRLPKLLDIVSKKGASSIIFSIEPHPILSIKSTSVHPTVETFQQRPSPAGAESLAHGIASDDLPEPSQSDFPNDDLAYVAPATKSPPAQSQSHTAEDEMEVDPPAAKTPPTQAKPDMPESKSGPKESPIEISDDDDLDDDYVPPTEGGKMFADDANDARRHERSLRMMDAQTYPDWNKDDAALLQNLSKNSNARDRDDEVDGVYRLRNNMEEFVNQRRSYQTFDYIEDGDEDEEYKAALDQAKDEKEKMAMKIGRILGVKDRQVLEQMTPETEQEVKKWTVGRVVDSGSQWKLPGTQCGLYPHQAIALLFLTKQTFGLRLAIISDGTGIGKTFEALAFGHLQALMLENWKEVEASWKRSDDTHLPEDASDPNACCPSQHKFVFECSCVPKSLTRLTVIKEGYNQIFCPSSLLGYWQSQFEKFFLRGHVKLSVGHGEVGAKPHAFYRSMAPGFKDPSKHGKPKLLNRNWVISTSGSFLSHIAKHTLRNQKEKCSNTTDLDKVYTELNPAVVIIDECHDNKTSETNFAKHIMPHLQICDEEMPPVVIGLSATPYHTGVFELQWLIQLFTKAWLKGGDAYWDTIKHTLPRKLRKSIHLFSNKKLEELRTSINTFMTQVKKADISLSKLRHGKDPASQLPPALRTLYNQIVAHSVTIIGAIEIRRDYKTRCWDGELFIKIAPIHIREPRIHLSESSIAKVKDFIEEQKSGVVDTLVSSLKSRLKKSSEIEAPSESLVKNAMKNSQHAIRPVTVFPYLIDMLKQGKIDPDWGVGTIREQGWFTAETNQYSFSKEIAKELLDSSQVMRSVIQNVRRQLKEVEEATSAWNNRPNPSDDDIMPSKAKIGRPKFLFYTDYNIVSICMRDCLIYEFAAEGHQIAPLMASHLNWTQRHNLIASVQEEKDLGGGIHPPFPDMLVATKKIGGQGITATEANYIHVVLPSLTEVPDKQVLGRTSRVGQYFESEGTVYYVLGLLEEEAWTDTMAMRKVLTSYQSLTVSGLQMCQDQLDSAPVEKGELLLA